MPSPTGSAATDLDTLTRPSGGFAMLAVDQREALRAMFAERYGRPVADAELTAFKVETVRQLSPYASGVLLDRQFCLDAVLEADAVAPGCGLIAAADEFAGDDREFVATVQIDEAVVPGEVKAAGAVALKLLVLWRPDEAPDGRIAMTEEFVRRCKEAGLLSIVEPVSRGPRDGSTWTPEDWNEGVFAAARELGNRGQDLYKAEVPLHGGGDEAAVRRGCAELTRSIDGPWVVLSTGVPHEQFPRAVELACGEGASGFLAGRAVWRQVIGADDQAAALETYAVPRLRELGDIVDQVVTNR
ncbi:MAG: aldolase [Streptosporangiales bacterium]|nr:aldolase [Streptosporangiales bacterium]